MFNEAQKADNSTFLGDDVAYFRWVGLSKKMIAVSLYDQKGVVYASLTLTSADGMSFVPYASRPVIDSILRCKDSNARHWGDKQQATFLRLREKLAQELAQWLASNGFTTSDNWLFTYAPQEPAQVIAQALAQESEPGQESESSPQGVHICCGCPEGWCKGCVPDESVLYESAQEPAQYTVSEIAQEIAPTYDKNRAYAQALASTQEPYMISSSYAQEPAQVYALHDEGAGLCQDDHEYYSELLLRCKRNVRELTQAGYRCERNSGYYVVYQEGYAPAHLVAWLSPYQLQLFTEQLVHGLYPEYPQADTPHFHTCAICKRLHYLTLDETCACPPLAPCGHKEYELISHYMRDLRAITAQYPAFTPESESTFTEYRVTFTQFAQVSESVHPYNEIEELVLRTHGASQERGVYAQVITCRCNNIDTAGELVLLGKRYALGEITPVHSK